MIQPDKIIRSARKTLAISIDRLGRLIVRAPFKCSEERIFAFIREKESWIVRMQTEKQRTGIRLPPEDLHGYEFLLLGKPTRIVIDEGKKVGYDGERNILYLPKDKPQERLVQWLKDNAKRIFTTITQRKAAEMSVGYKAVRISSARSRWGSCAGDCTIRYTFRLLYCPKEVIEYVVVHELSHVRHRNHAKAFWQEVERYMPDWKAKRAWLKAHGALLEIF